MGDEQILSYKGTVLRGSDLYILNNPNCYLNDDIIGFYFKYLSSQFGKSVLLVEPCISSLLANNENLDEIKAMIEGMELSEKKIVIFSINNNNVFEMGDDGTHWSVLVYSRDMNSFIHHDSMQGVNDECATRLYENVKRFVAAPSSNGKHNNKKKKASQPAVPSFPHSGDDKTPQQINGYDCGLYVMAIAKTICDWHVSKSRGKDANWFSAMEENVTEKYVEREMRSEVVKLILDEAKGSS